MVRNCSGTVTLFPDPNDVSTSMMILFNCLRNWDTWGA